MAIQYKQLDENNIQDLTNERIKVHSREREVLDEDGFINMRIDFFQRKIY